MDSEQLARPGGPSIGSGPVVIRSPRPGPTLLSRLGGFSLAAVAPLSGGVPSAFTNVTADTAAREAMIGAIQRFRGGVYAEDGTIPASALDARGRHWTPFDEESWHLVVVDPVLRISGCVRLTIHGGGIRTSGLKLFEVISRMGPEQGCRYGAAVDAFMEESRRLGLGVAEAGGWAVRRGHRCGSKSLVVVLSLWSLLQAVGDCRMIATAGRCNRSAEMLHRLGGTALSLNGAELPAFFDDHHRCDIELLGFDSRFPDDRFVRDVAAIRTHLVNALVLAPSAA